MPNYKLTPFMLLIAAIMMMAPFTDSEAKRFGGGRSFGGRSFYSTPYKRSQIPRRPSYSRQKAVQRNQDARQSWRNRGGFLGMLAPFLIGGLLGSMFFGGAFENINLADLLVFGGLAFLAFKPLTRRPKPAPDTLYGYGSPPPDSTHSQFEEHLQPRRNKRGFATDLLFGQGKAEDPKNPNQSMPIVPRDFDVESFLEEAKQVFINLQEAWNRDELADIRGLTTDDVFIEIKDQRNHLADDQPTRILELDARLLDFNDQTKTQEAAVLFTALIQEGDQTPERVQEVWHFVRSKQDFAPHWILDGIQQVD